MIISGEKRHFYPSGFWAPHLEFHNILWKCRYKADNSYMALCFVLPFLSSSSNLTHCQKSNELRAVFKILSSGKRDFRFLGLAFCRIRYGRLNRLLVNVFQEAKKCQGCRDGNRCILLLFTNVTRFLHIGMAFTSLILHHITPIFTLVV